MQDRWTLVLQLFKSALWNFVKIATSICAFTRTCIVVICCIWIIRRIMWRSGCWDWIASPFMCCRARVPWQACWGNWFNWKSMSWSIKLRSTIKTSSNCFSFWSPYHRILLWWLRVRMLWGWSWMLLRFSYLLYSIRWRAPRGWRTGIRTCRSYWWGTGGCSACWWNTWVWSFNRTCGLSCWVRIASRID